ncbi:MAG: DUF927 domain-containing protein [Holophagaceae bacterium]|nr:DUF927 domain-containing protein [Holophagaceae bacterium]
MSNLPKKLITNGHAYHFKTDGTYSAVTNDDGKLIEIPITKPRIDPWSYGSDGLTDNYSLLVKWQNSRKRDREARLPYSIIATEPKKVVEPLSSGGVTVYNVKLLRQLLTDIQNTDLPYTLFVAETGWHGNKYVLPTGRVIGSDKGDAILYIGESSLAGKEAERVRGTFEDWKTKVAAKAVGNPHLAFDFCAGVAGVFLRFFPQVAGGFFHDGGESSHGKTIKNGASMSMWSNPAHMIKWHSTANYILERAPEFNDGAYFVDDLKRKGGFGDFASVIYSLGDGTGKGRLDSSSKVQDVALFRLIGKSSGERGLAQVIDQNDLHAGLKGRFVEILEPDGGWFRELHGAEHSLKFALDLKRDSLLYYGHAGPALIERICTMLEKDPAAFQSMIDRYADEFNGLLQGADGIPSDAAGLVRRVQALFTVTAVAGRIATELGIFPWPPDLAFDSVLEVIKGWLDNRGHTGDDETATIAEIFVNFVESRAESMCDVLDDPEHIAPRNHAPNNRIGSISYSEDGDNIARTYHLRTTLTLNAAFDKVKYDTKRINKALHDSGLIVRSEGKSPKYGTAAKISTWSGKQRFYVITPEILSAYHAKQESQLAKDVEQNPSEDELKL